MAYDDSFEKTDDVPLRFYDVPLRYSWKDIGERDCKDLFQAFEQQNAYAVNKIIKKHGLRESQVPCFDEYGDWAWTYGENAGGHECPSSWDCYWIKEEFDPDNTCITRLYSVAEIAAHLNASGCLPSKISVRDVCQWVVSVSPWFSRSFPPEAQSLESIVIIIIACYYYYYYYYVCRADAFPSNFCLCVCEFFVLIEWISVYL